MPAQYRCLMDDKRGELAPLPVLVEISSISQALANGCR
jgi:hypothetical protein